MLQNIRDKSQGWIAKVIIGFIILLLALTGFEAIFNSMNQEEAAEVNGQAIAPVQVEQAVQLQRRQLAQQLGPDFDASLLDDRLLRDSALKGLIDRILLVQGARESGFAFSQAALDQLIIQTPEFQVDGRFNAARFDQVIAQMGYNRMQFRSMLEEEMLIGQLRAGIAGSGFVTDQEVQAFASLEQQTRDFATLTVKAAPQSVQVGDDEVAAYYEENKSRYMSPEQVVIDYIELNRNRFEADVQVDEQALRELYQKEIGNLAEQRRAAHILIEVNDKTSDEQARQQIADVQKRLEAGEDFASVAKEVSQDPGSASNGGDLGFAGKGVYDPAFEKALYGLNEGDVSEPVRTDYGWHLIKLLGVQKPDVPTFEALRPKLESELKAQEVETRFVDASKQLEDIAFESSDLSQPAQELGIKVQTSAPFGREGGDGLTANRQLVQAAFSPEVLEDGANSQLIELDPDTAIVLRVKEHRTPEQLPLEKVSSAIREQLLNERAAEEAKAKADAQLTALREGKTKDDAGNWQVVEAAKRNQDGVEPAVLQQLFRMAKPEADQGPTFASVALPNGDNVIIRLDGVSAPVSEMSKEDIGEYRRFLASRRGQEEFLAYRQLQESNADIERN